jgi:hypothetical protein
VGDVNIIILPKSIVQNVVFLCHNNLNIITIIIIEFIMLISLKYLLEISIEISIFRKSVYFEVLIIILNIFMKMSYIKLLWKKK